MRRVLAQIELARTSFASVCIVGESGTGREHIARTIHYESDSAKRAFVPLDCGRLPAVDLKLTLKRLAEALGDVSQPPHLTPGTIYFASDGQMPRDCQELVVER